MDLDTRCKDEHVVLFCARCQAISSPVQSQSNKFVNKNN
jgi:hypothetical protein